MGGWYLCPALTTLRNEVNLVFPDRALTSDGTIGDPDHMSRYSDHNKDYRGAVHAWDITEDPAAVALRKFLIETRDDRMAYMIAHKQIMSSTVAPWAWRPYNGSNPHIKHTHISASRRLGHDGSAWGFSAWARQQSLIPSKDTDMGLTYVEYGDNSIHVGSWQVWLRDALGANTLVDGRPIEVDDQYGDQTAKAAAMLLGLDRDVRSIGRWQVPRLIAAGLAQVPRSTVQVQASIPEHGHEVSLGGITVGSPRALDPAD